jgi:NAD(P)-dependent dehydrogenase (short-subunit alcohol dehydrogenase family)
MNTVGPGRLEGKRCFVTGGAGCIGAAIVKRFLEEGADVTFCDIDDTKGEKLVGELLESGFAQDRCRYVNCDVSSEADVSATMKELFDDDGLDILVNNAALFLFGKVEEVSEETWDRVFAVNVKGYAFTCKHAHPYLKKSQKGAAIVNMASISSFVAQSAFVPYNTSKGAVLQMTRCLALDMASDGIRVNAVCPGVVDTEAVSHHAQALGRDREEVARNLSSLHVLPGLVAKEEVANACLFLASSESSFITGHPLMVDGGWSLR